MKRAAAEKLFPNLWAVPSGHVEARGTIWDTVVRGLYEETGLLVKSVNEEYAQMEWLDDKGHNSVHLYFIVEVEDDSDVKRA